MDEYELKQQAKKHLNQIYWLTVRKDQHMIELDQLQREAVSLGATDYSRVIVKSSHQNTLENIAVKIGDMYAAIKQDIETIDALKSEISAQIDLVENEACRAILRYRYICLCDWSDVESRMNYSHGHIMRKHNQALLAFAQMMRHNETSTCGNMIA